MCRSISRNALQKHMRETVTEGICLIRATSSEYAIKWTGRLPMSRAAQVLCQLQRIMPDLPECSSKRGSIRECVF